MTFNRIFLLSIITTSLLLSACGGGGDSENLTVSIEPKNTTPVARAGDDMTVTLGDVVTLDGSASSDADGDSLNYEWKVVSSPSSSATGSIHFTDSMTQSIAPSEAGEYEISLTVKDGNLSSIADNVLISVIRVNSLPIAIIAGDTQVQAGVSISLSAANSNDEDNDSLTYSWEFIAKPEGSGLNSGNLAQERESSFKPDVIGVFIIQLTANDGTDNSEAVTHTITATANAAPIVSAHVDLEYSIGGEAYFYAVASDADSTALNYFWVITSVPEGSVLVGNTSDNPYFTYVPDVAGEYKAKLTVSDDFNSVVVEETTATINDAYEYGYSIGGSTQYFGKVNENILLDFATSDSPNGKELSYTWSLRSGPNGSRPTLTNSIVNKAETQFKSNITGTYRVLVQATDDEGYGQVESIYITLLDADTNMVPKAIVENTHFVTLGSEVEFDARESFDLENDLLHYEWVIERQPSGSNLTLSDSNAINFAVTPEIPGYYNFKLKVTDGISSGMSYYNGWLYVYEETVKTTAFTLGEIFAKEGDTITLNGTASIGVDDSTTVAWNIINAPYNSSAEIVNADTLTPTIELDADGKFVFQVRLMKGEEVVSIEHLTVRAKENALPIANASDDISAIAGESIELTASDSSDAESSTLTYNWSVVGVENSTASLPFFDNDTAENPILMLDGAFTGQIVIGLTVADGIQTSLRDEIIIDVNEAIATARLESVNLTTFLATGIELPYDESVVIEPLSVQPSEDGLQVMGVFNLHADYADLRMTNITIVDKNGVIEPKLSIIDFNFSLPANEQVELDYNQDINIDADDFVVITIVSPTDTGGNTALIELSFEIVETGETFKVMFEYTNG
jgi:hypothetical protein